MRNLWAVMACALAVLLPMGLRAEVPGGMLDGARQVYLVEPDGTRHAVAQIDFAAPGYSLTWNDAMFEDAFLSMRPFKCLTGPQKHWCRVPYPYDNPRDLSGDLVDLEYDLLFLWKGAGEYGINMWNGVYYRLAPEGDRLIGTMHEMDMNILAAPPEDGVLRPVEAKDLELAEPDGHWLSRLIIE